jgi:two-component system LytT family sensor kinase
LLPRRQKLLNRFCGSAAAVQQKGLCRRQANLRKKSPPMNTAHPPTAGWRGFFTRSWAFWQLNLFFWGLYGMLAFGTRLAIGQTVGRALIFTLVLEGTCLFLSLALRSLYRRGAYEFGLWSGFLVIVLSLAAAGAQGLVAAGFTALTGWHNPMFDFFVNVTLRLLVMWASFMIWSLGYYWLWAETERSLESNRRAAAQREAQRMELQMLRAQLDPHFLFNSLNGIAAEIRPHPDVAIEMVGELSDYLRYSLDHRKQPVSRLSTELSAMESYLRIERARFGDRLHFHVEASEPARMRLVPGFLLQPLVENAVKHGLDRSAATLDIGLRARVEGPLLEITVTNSGTMAPADPAHAGLGLETLRRRLELHYPQRHQFTIEERDGHVTATLQLWDPPCSA